MPFFQIITVLMCKCCVRSISHVCFSVSVGVRVLCLGDWKFIRVDYLGVWSCLLEYTILGISQILANLPMTLLSSLFMSSKTTLYIMHQLTSCGKYICSQFLSATCVTKQTKLWLFLSFKANSPICKRTLCTFAELSSSVYFYQEVKSVGKIPFTHVIKIF